MGYLTDKYIKDKGKKWWIQTILDIFLILMLLLIGLSAKSEFNNGARFILQNVPAFCINDTLYQKTLEYYGLSEGKTYTISTQNWSVTGLYYSEKT